MPRMTEINSRFVHLEAARGLASIIVVIHHFLLAFAPLLKTDIWNGGLKYTPLYVFENGTAAVAFFFVLSGFVLTQRFYMRFNGMLLAQSAAKRLPRLMLPAGLSVLAGYAVLVHGPDYYLSASVRTGSEWLARFANGLNDAPAVPTFMDAVRQTLFIFFRKNDSYYNSNLWTMSYEFYGSMIVFGLVLLIAKFQRRPTWQIIIFHILLAYALSRLVDYLFTYFIAGALIAYLFRRKPEFFAFPTWVMMIFAASALACFSAENKYALLVGSMMVLIGLLSPNRLSNWLAQPWGVVPGRLSFPLYLVHVLVILSLSSGTYLFLLDLGAAQVSTVIATFVVTMTLSLIAALPFVKLEQIWIPTLNRRVQQLAERVGQFRVTTK